MNLLLKKISILALAATSVPAVLGETAKPKPAPVKPLPVRSVFVMPTNVREGRDPFFPESPRPYEEAVSSKSPLDAHAFVVKGISIERGLAMVIINNHTFAVGDEGDVLTEGKRVHIRLVSIQGTVVTIEVNGSRRELNAGIK